MKINIAGTIFEIHFLYEKEYLTYFSSYQVEEGSPDFFIYQDTYEENVDKGDLKIESKAYDLYVQDDLDIQYQKNINNEYIGKIIYDKESSRFSSKDNHDYLNVVTMLLYIVTRYLMTHKDCILMLGSAFSYKGKGIIITSSSEEDASIHTSLWNQYFDIVYINDRINFIIKDNDKLW